MIIRYRSFAGRKARIWDEHYIKYVDIAAANEIMRVGPSTLAGTLIAQHWAGKMALANKRAQDASDLSLIHI